MKWIGRRGSSNIEDRRGMGGGKIAMGGGIGSIIVIAIVWLLGGDPGQVLNQMQGQGNQQVANPAAEDSMAKFVSVVLADTEEIWGTIFEEYGETYRKPTLVLFRGAVQSACGSASSASGPFYCSQDEKIYIDLSFCDELRERFGAPGDFAIAYVIAHEVGHHVQNLLGTLGKVDEQRGSAGEKQANKLTVKLELQADYYAGVWAYHAQNTLHILEQGDIGEAINAAAAVGDDRLQMQTQGHVVPDAFTHGTSEQRMQWFKRGYQSGRIEDGDTFRSI
ncbi:MAG: neutral zinc metallopeptidase [Chloroflexota bacterium]|nr:neutral zinc metallopeptidase [Lentimicrobium sp.]